MIVQCCVCRKIREAEEWVEPSGTPYSPGEVSHGYCPPCAAQAFAELSTALEALEQAHAAMNADNKFRKAS